MFGVVWSLLRACFGRDTPVINDEACGHPSFLVLYLKLLALLLQAARGCWVLALLMEEED